MAGEHEEALKHYEQALHLQRAIGDRSGEATTLTAMGDLCQRARQLATALLLYAETLPLRRAVGERPGETRTLYHMGVAYARSGLPEKALECYSLAASLQQEMGNLEGERDILINALEVHQQVAAHASAQATLVRIVQLDRELYHPDLKQHSAQLRRVRASSVPLVCRGETCRFKVKPVVPQLELLFGFTNSG